VCPFTERFLSKHIPNLKSVAFCDFLKRKFSYLIRQFSWNERSVGACLGHNIVNNLLDYSLISPLKQVRTNLICTCVSTFAFGFDIFSQQEYEVTETLTSKHTNVLRNILKASRRSGMIRGTFPDFFPRYAGAE